MHLDATEFHLLGAVDRRVAGLDHFHEGRGVTELGLDAGGGVGEGGGAVAAPERRDLAFDHLADGAAVCGGRHALPRSEEHTSKLQSLMRNSYAVFCLKKKKK